MIVLPTANAQILAPLFFKFKPEPTDESIGTSSLGTPIYSNLIFNADSDTPENKDIRLDTVLMDVNQDKNIIRTIIQGRNGTVKEYIGMGDYDINILGAIVSPYPNLFPKDDVNALKNIMILDKEIAVASSFLQLFSIHSIVISGFRIAEKMGSRNEVPFQIRAWSDQPFELKSRQL